MSSRIPTTAASSKDASRSSAESKSSPSALTSLPSVPALKFNINKVTPKEQGKEMSPEPERAELLGSLTTQQQQRTSARVIKKLKLEPPPDKKKRSDADETAECDTPNKIDDKELKFPTVKQRMPKALWSTDEKNLFFEALNEYGKDFDAITAYICAKMKKKGMPDVNLKTKTQVSHFYYRTWHKLSKHVHFDENVKKVAQELYALINYGEMRKKLVSVNEKTCGRLGEMVLGGSIMVRARGKNMRVRTPMCRALRRLNQITERACGSRICSVASVQLRARSAGAWARVQAAAHNPRAAATAHAHTRLADFIHALARRWRSGSHKKSVDEECQQRDDEADHLNLETDRLIVRERNTKLALHVGPRPGADIQLPVVRASEHLSSQKICFSSYLERMGEQRQRRDGAAKIRTPKRQRKDSASEKDKDVDHKKFKVDEQSIKLINIEETAIDGIELMASYKSNQEDERPSTEDEKEIKEELLEMRAGGEEELEKEEAKDKEETKDDMKSERDESGKEKEMSEREKDSFSEMEDDEKYVKSDTDNESDSGKVKDRKFKNLKVKFRIRPKKRGGSVYTLVTDEFKNDHYKPDREDKDAREDKDDKPNKEDKDDKPSLDTEMALRQIRRGWSEMDAGELTIGDLYLMFGSRSKLELDYWWAEPTPPLPQSHRPSETIDKEREKQKPEKCDKAEKNDRLEKNDKEKTDSSVEEDKVRESDADICSPKLNHDSNDASGDDVKSTEIFYKNKCQMKLNDQLSSPEHKWSSGLQLVSKLVNRPEPAEQPSGFSLLSDRLKRLLALAGNPLTSKARGCSGASKRAPRPAPPRPATSATTDHLFRHPTPIAPKEADTWSRTLELGEVGRRARGRPRAAPQRRVVVQRLLPLLPKLPPPHPLIPVKISANAPPAPPRILPKPPPTSTSDLSFFYVLSESNGQFFFHDGDRRIPITQATASEPDIDDYEEDDIRPEELSSEASHNSIEVPPVSLPPSQDPPSQGPPTQEPPTQGPLNDPSLKQEMPVKAEQTGDIGNFLTCSSLSPSRLLREESWLESAVHDFSLSSFLTTLEGRPHTDLAVDSQLQSLMVESSVDYVAKFADLAAEVADPDT